MAKVEAVKIVERMLENSDKAHFLEVKKGGVVIPIYWVQDEQNNINFDVDSIRDDFDFFIAHLEEHNERTNFNW